MEPSVELYKFVYERGQRSGTNHRLALHLSNIQGATLSGLAHAVPVQETRLIDETMWKSAPSCEGFLRTLNGGSITMWAPTDTATSLHLASAFEKYSFLPGAKGTLHLLVPHNPFPGCTTPEQFLIFGGMSCSTQNGVP